MESTTVTPSGLRAATHAIILDGEEGTSASRRHAGHAWTVRLVAAFTPNYRELMDLYMQHPALTNADLRLLELCLADADDDASRDLIIAAMGGEETPFKYFRTDFSAANQATQRVWERENAGNMPRTSFQIRTNGMDTTVWTRSRQGEARFRRALTDMGAKFDEQQVRTWLDDDFR